jgi:hypothetical protein
MEVKAAVEGGGEYTERKDTAFVMEKMVKNLRLRSFPDRTRPSLW